MHDLLATVSLVPFPNSAPILQCHLAPSVHRTRGPVRQLLRPSPLSTRDGVIAVTPVEISDDYAEGVSDQAPVAALIVYV